MGLLLPRKFSTCSYQNDLGVPPKTLVKNIKERKILWLIDIEMRE